jgi:hypothetical protein
MSTFKQVKIFAATSALLLALFVAPAEARQEPKVGQFEKSVGDAVNAAIKSLTSDPAGAVSKLQAVEGKAKRPSQEPATSIWRSRALSAKSG